MSWDVHIATSRIFGCVRMCPNFAKSGNLTHSLRNPEFGIRGPGIPGSGNPGNSGNPGRGNSGNPGIRKSRRFSEFGELGKFAESRDLGIWRILGSAHILFDLPILGTFGRICPDLGVWGVLTPDLSIMGFWTTVWAYLGGLAPTYTPHMASRGTKTLQNPPVEGYI